MLCVDGDDDDVCESDCVFMFEVVKRLFMGVCLLFFVLFDSFGDGEFECEEV